MVLLSSSRLRKEREATWGFPQRSVSSSTSSSNLIHRAVSRQCGSWLRSNISSFSSTNTCSGYQGEGPEAARVRAVRRGKLDPQGQPPRRLLLHEASDPTSFSSSSCAGWEPGRWGCLSRPVSGMVSSLSVSSHQGCPPADGLWTRPQGSISASDLHGPHAPGPCRTHQVHPVVMTDRIIQVTTSQSWTLTLGKWQDTVQSHLAPRTEPQLKADPSLRLQPHPDPEDPTIPTGPPCGAVGLMPVPKHLAPQNLQHPNASPTRTHPTGFCRAAWSPSHLPCPGEQLGTGWLPSYSQAATPARGLGWPLTGSHRP